MTTAHPHRALRSGELVSYATRFGPFTTYRVYAQDEHTKRRRVIARLPAQIPSYMHSFAITEHHIVLVEFPFTVTPVTIPLSGRPLIANYRWKPRHGTRFRVLDLDTGKMRVTCQGEPFFAFHHVNAYERGKEIILDLCGYDDAGIVGALYLDQLRTDEVHLPRAQLRRYRLRLNGGNVTREPIPDVSLELPRIDYTRRNGRPYRYVYGTGSRGDGGFPDRITKVDVERGASTAWSEPDTYPGEPVFVRTPGTEREDASTAATFPDSRRSPFIRDATEFSPQRQRSGPKADDALTSRVSNDRPLPDAVNGSKEGSSADLQLLKHPESWCRSFRSRVTLGLATREKSSPCAAEIT